MDLRRADEAQLLDALRAQDLLALAECWQRTAPAAHAVARRLLGAADQIEAVLGEVYTQLWQSPPPDGPLERWARAHTFALAAERLRSLGHGPSAPSCALVLTDLPPARRAATDPVERVIAELPPAAAAALVRAHDAGVPAAEQPDPDAAGALEQALEALAQQTLEAGAVAGEASAGPLADVVLGLVPAGMLDADASEPAMAERLRFLRRGRRRLEGLPPAPELGPRILLGVVARTGAAAPPAASPAASPPASPAVPPRPEPSAAWVREDDVVVTVARQQTTDSAAAVAPAAPSAAARAAAHEDTGPIALIAPEEPSDAAAPDADGDFPVWPGDAAAIPGALSPSWPGEDTDEAAPAVTPAEPVEPAAPRVRRGVGLLLIGTALGMLAGAVAVAVR